MRVLFRVCFAPFAALQSLSELIRRTKRFTEDEGRRYMKQILEATSYLHRHQIIHRDLKLGNLFLDRDWNIKVGGGFFLSCVFLAPVWALGF